MASQFRILFAGGVLEGHVKADVKQAAAGRLKLSSKQAETIFSGQKIILKKGLSSVDATRYASELEKIGMRVRVQEIVTGPPKAKSEQIVSQAAPSATKSASAEWPPIDANLPWGGKPAKPVATAPAPTAEEVFDPEKTHLYSPDHYSAYEAKVSSPSQVSVPPAPPASPPSPPKPAPVAQPIAEAPHSTAFAAPVAEVQQASVHIAAPVIHEEAGSLSHESSSMQPTPIVEEDPPLLGFGFEGRVGRVGFLIGSIVVMSLVILLVLLGAYMGKTVFVATLVITGIPGLYFGLRLSCLRLHDMGANGRLSVLALIPPMYLFLVLFPGNRASNRYGHPGSTAGAVPVMISIGVFALIVAAAYLFFPKNLFSG